MKKRAILIIALLFYGVIARVSAQVDPHFSQFYAYPLWLNPALTGVMDGDTRVSANFKDQWTGLDGYTTTGLSADFKTTKKVSLGINVIDQSAGTAGYNYLAAYGSFGYAIAISSGGTQKLSFGLQVGLINRGFEENKLQLDNQYNPGTGFDPNLPSNENFSSTSSTIFDASAGIYYYDTDADNAASLFGGVSAAHLTNANDPFATYGIKSKLPIRFTGQAGVKIKAADFLDITPSLLYIRQQQNQIRAVDIYSELKFPNDYSLFLGGMYRLNDAVVADVGYRIRTVIIGLSYDFNTSPLKMATSGEGGFELSVNYVFGSGNSSTSNSSPSF